MSDFILFGSKTRLKTWILAIAIATLLTTILRLMGQIDIVTSIYLEPSLGWMALLLGGWLFGFGMVLSGGCASRNVVRLGSGSLKALFVVLVMSIVAAATSFGWLRWMYEALDVVRTPDLHGQGLGLMEIMGSAIGGGFGIIIALAAIGYCLADQGLRSSVSNIIVALTLGILVPVGWIITGSTLLQDQPYLVPQSLGYLVPAGELLRILTSPFGLGLSFAIVAWMGTAVGAAISSWFDGSFRFETFSNHDDMIRHFKGAILMGLGGVLAAGCTIGQGVSGISTLAPASLVAVFAMFMGTRRGLRYLETGVFWRHWKARPSGS